MKNKDLSDPIDPLRSALMARVRQRNSGPELKVRSILRALGITYGLHRKSLPGTPDITVPTRDCAIFVHGCFWHRHEACPKATTPKTRRTFWQEKFERNVARDAQVSVAIRKLGWNVIVVWECETRYPLKLARRLARILRVDFTPDLLAAIEHEQARKSIRYYERRIHKS